MTITLPKEVVQSMDRVQKNRSAFALDAIQKELLRRRRSELAESLRNPHPESLRVAEAGLSDWVRALPREVGQAMVDSKKGQEIHWTKGRGWIQGKK